MRWLAGVMLMAGMAAGAQGADEPVKELKPPRLAVLAGSGRVPHPGYLQFDVRVENPNAAALPYSGYLSESFEGGLPKGVIAPSYQMEVLRQGEWKPVMIGRCGTGRGPVSIEKGAEKRFDVVVPSTDWESIRIGITWLREGPTPEYKTAWTPAITQDAIRQPLPKR